MTTSTAPRSDSVLVGVAFMLLATFCFPSMDSIAKYLLESGYPTAQVVWARYAGQCLIVLLIFAPRLREVARTERLGLQLIRSGFLFGATFFFFLALSEQDLADTVAVMFAAPLIVTALAGPLLGEKVGIWRWSAVLIGFGGMLLIVRPAGDSFNLYALSAVAAAALFALYQISTRWLSGSDGPDTTLFYSALLGGVLMSGSAPFSWSVDWITPDLSGAALMFGMGALGTLGQFALILAFQSAPASLLTPFTYMSLLWATVYQYLLFQSFPDQMTLLGAAIVVAAGLVIIWRERVRARANAPR